MIGLTQDELHRLALFNLHTLVHPALKVQQMRLAPPDSADLAKGVGFFHFIETGHGLEASCLLLAPIWDTLRSLVHGELRVVVPNPASCMFCGADDLMTLAMMTGLARSTKAESGASGLSDLAFTVCADGRVMQC